LLPRSNDRSDVVKRLLLISYYFPPSGGPGVQRTVKFVKYLREFGWDPTVLTVDPRFAAYPSIDHSLDDDVPHGVKVVRTRSWDPYGVYAAMTGRRKSETISVSFSGESRPNLRQRFGRWIRGNVFLPDARVGWVPFALQEARRLVGEAFFDAVMTTGPPHSTHLVGLRVARRSSLPWLADFRDPWTGIDFSHLLPTHALARRIDASLERRVLSDADRVSIVSPVCAEHLESRYSRSYVVIMNGFDESDFGRTEVEGRGAFFLSYMGSMDASRNPDVLWKAMSQSALRSSPLRVRLIGRVDPAILDSVRFHGLSDRVEVLDQVDHAEATRLMCTSPLLLLVINKTPLAAGIVPGKAFEYVGSGRPVLGVGPTLGDAADLLRTTGAGLMYDHDDVDGGVQYLGRQLEAWASGAPESGANVTDAGLHTRRSRTRQLAEVLDELCDGGRE